MASSPRRIAGLSAQQLAEIRDLFQGDQNVKSAQCPFHAALTKWHSMAVDCLPRIRIAVRQHEAYVPAQNQLVRAYFADIFQAGSAEIAAYATMCQPCQFYNRAGDGKFATHCNAHKISGSCYLPTNNCA